MKFQALLFALVVLISLLISPAGIKNTAVSSSKIAEPSLPIQTGASAPRGIATVADALTRNLTAVGQLIADNFSGVIPENKIEFSSDSNSGDSVTGNSDVLASQSNIADNKTFSCDLDQLGFTSQTILVKGLKQFPSASQIIFQLNPEKRWPIASISKLMTAIVAFEKMDLNKEIILSEKAIASGGAIGSFKAGEIFKLKDLIKAMLILSSNDAASAVAENFKDSQQDFINEMQKKAAGLKMFSTSYLEPTGLSFINQSTVSDLSKLMEYIYLNHSEILEITGQKETQIMELKSGKWRKLSNIDKFAGEPDFIGGKTGYIDEAGRNLMALFNINNGTILTIVLGSEDAFAETEKLKGFIENCR